MKKEDMNNTVKNVHKNFYNILIKVIKNKGHCYNILDCITCVLINYCEDINFKGNTFNYSYYYEKKLIAFKKLLNKRKIKILKDIL